MLPARRSACGLSRIRLLHPGKGRKDTPSDTNGPARVAGILNVMRLQEVAANYREFEVRCKTPRNAGVASGIGRDSKSRQRTHVPIHEV